MLRIGLIIGSTRPNRFADVPARWILEASAARDDIEVLALDLRDQNLPFFCEPVSPSATNGVYSHPAAEAWRQQIGSCDGFIVTVAEYNHGPTAVLKNALDSAFKEWNRKPMAFVGYGGVGGARAIEQLRCVAAELQMVPIKFEVNIAMEPFLGILTQGKSPKDYDYLGRSLSLMLDDLVWWTASLKCAREPLAR